MTQRRIYQDEFPYFITTKTRDGIWFFEKKYSKILSDIIFYSCKLKNYILYAYCIMPDHLHMLIKQIVNNIDPTAPAERCAGFGFGNHSILNPARVSEPAVGDV